MSGRKKLVIGLAVWAAVSLAVGIAVSVANPAAAHDGASTIPPVSVCNPARFSEYGHGGYNWRWIACNHQLHGHQRWRNGQGTDRTHTVKKYQAQAAAFRAYCGIH
jgi:hypothetical protein